MTKETSAEIASIASELLGLTALDLVGLDVEAAGEQVTKIHSVAASALGQREADPDAPPAPDEPAVDRCRICGCTETTPCIYGGATPCAWTDDSRTLCDNPHCLEEAAKIDATTGGDGDNA